MIWTCMTGKGTARGDWKNNEKTPTFRADQETAVRDRVRFMNKTVISEVQASENWCFRLKAACLWSFFTKQINWKNVFQE